MIQSSSDRIKGSDGAETHHPSCMIMVDKLEIWRRRVALIAFRLANPSALDPAAGSP